MSNELWLAGKGSNFKKQETEPAGFWAGFWHGVAMPISFIWSLFSEDYSIYETFNKGQIYEFGFILGTGSGVSLVF